MESEDVEGSMEKQLRWVRRVSCRGAVSSTLNVSQLSRIVIRIQRCNINPNNRRTRNENGDTDSLNSFCNAVLLTGLSANCDYYDILYIIRLITVNQQGQEPHR